MAPENTREKREDGIPIGRPFTKGNPGRPKGARNKLGEQFLQALQEDFEQNGVVAIEVVRAEKPDQYLKIIAGILPKEMNLNVNDQAEMSDDELLDRIRTLHGAIAPFLDGTGKLNEGIAAAKGAKQPPRLH